MATPLKELHEQLTQLCESVGSFPAKAQLYRPPIIDVHEEYGEQELPGLKKFRNTVENELRWVDQLLHSAHPPENLPSSNAPFLFAVWKEVLAARRPLAAISRPLSNKNSVKDGLKIDVVSAGGRLWTKVNTIKASRLLLEFREQDSYVNSDYDDTDDDDPETNPLAELASYPFSPVNSLTKQCYQLQQAADEQRLRTGEPPTILYRLTRMSQDVLGDRRIQETYACIREMGIQLRFGESVQRIVSAGKPFEDDKPVLIATTKLNLDLSLLIALVSDITHAVLPLNEADADERFKPMPRAWKRQALASKAKGSDEELDLGAEEHFRALAGQVKEEMRSALVDDLRSRLRASASSSGVSGAEAELWTTEEAKRRCKVIVDKIGGPSEKRRCEEMFKTGPNDFWSGSRHAVDADTLSELHVKVFEENEEGYAPVVTSAETNTFRRALQDTCEILVNLGSDKVASVPLSTLPFAFDKDEPRRAPSKKSRAGEAQKIHIPTSHTSRSLLEGTKRGMTTVTANRMSIKQSIRAMGRLDGLTDDKDEHASIWVVEPKTLSEQKRSDLTDEQSGRSRNPSALYTSDAVVWVVEPRSLAETMRTV